MAPSRNCLPQGGNADIPGSPRHVVAALPWTHGATRGRASVTRWQQRRGAPAREALPRRRCSARDWAHFTAWCTPGGHQPLPADPRNVALYLVDLADGQSDLDPPEPPRSIATIARRLAGIGHVHREAGHPNPGEHDGVRRTLRGIRRASARAGAAPGKARPLGTEEVRLLVADLPNSLAGHRDRPRSCWATPWPCGPVNSPTSTSRT